MSIRLSVVVAVSVAVLGCSAPRVERPLALTNEKWTVGDSVWFRVAVIDSVHSADTAYQHSRKNKAVLLTILSTGATAHLRWQEFGLMPADADSASWFKQPEWIPTYELEYACDPDGRIERLLNYPELRDLSDTLTRVYLRQAVGLTPDQFQRTYEWTMDSMRLVDGLMSDAELLHAAYGMRFTYDTVTWAEIPGMPAGYHGPRFRAELSPNQLCDPATTIAFLLRAEVDSIDYSDLVADTDPRAAILDTLMSQGKPAFISMDCCFDTLRDLPVLVEQIMSFQMKELMLKRTTTIHLDERWTRRPEQ